MSGSVRGSCSPVPTSSSVLATGSVWSPLTASAIQHLGLCHTSGIGTDIPAEIQALYSGNVVAAIIYRLAANSYAYQALLSFGTYAVGISTAGVVAEV
jgi:hypothetical protein